MATIKSHTDLDQSRKLAEILPLESADMYYALSEDESTNMINFGKPQGFFDKTQVAWSLAALLSVLPSYELNNFGNAIQLGVKREALETEGDETLLDLVVNTIIHLHERKIL